MRVHDGPSLLGAVARARVDKRIHRIELASGTYELSQALVIDEALSGTAARPFVVAGAPGARAVLTGAVRLPSLEWQRWKGRVWRAKLCCRSFQRLWLDRRLLVRARYPNLDPGALLGGVAADATAPERVRRWHDPDGAVLHALQGNGWGGVQVPILGKKDDGSLVFGAQVGNNRAMPPSERDRFVENVFEELDAPGEWFLDAKHGWLYFEPPGAGRPPSDGFRAGAAEVLIRIEGKQADVRFVDVHALVFEDTEPTFRKAIEPLLRSDWKFARVGAVTIENAGEVRIAESEFEDLGGHAIVVSGRADAVRVVGNHIHDIGGTAIAFVGRPSAVRSPLFEYGERLDVAAIDPVPGPKSDDYPKDSAASDNLVHDIGRIDKQAAGIEIAMAARIDVDHNTIYRVPRAAINVGDGTWGGHRITYNDAFDTVLETGDHGTFNSWGRDRWWHPDRQELDRRVAAHRELVGLDAIAPILIRRNRLRCDHGWDIDLDDGASNYLIEENLLLSGGLKLREGFSRIVRGNILVNSTFHPHVWFDGSGDVFESNIVMTDYQPIGMHAWGRSVDRNAFAEAGDLERARSRGTDAHSVAGNPGFAKPSDGDFTVTNGALGAAVGFVNFPMDEFGVRPARLRALAQRPRFTLPGKPPGDPTPEAPRTGSGLTFKSVQTLGEQSAAGLASRSGALVLSVDAGSAGKRAGLLEGDVIVGWRAVTDASDRRLDDAHALAAVLEGLQAQAGIELAVVRNQARIHIHLATR